MNLIRQQEILKYVKEKEYARVNDLADTFHISQETVRRDIKELEKQNQVKKSHGGVYYKNSVSDTMTFTNRIVKNLKEKQSIAEMATRIVEDRDVVAILAGSTTYLMAKYLRDKRKLTIITNDYQMGHELSMIPANRVILLGGQLMPDEHGTCGDDTSNILSQYFPDKLFFSPTGISNVDKITAYFAEERNLIQAGVKNAIKSYCLCDHSKFERKGMYYACNINELTGVITDWKTPQWVLNEIESKKINVMVGKRSV